MISSDIITGEINSSESLSPTTKIPTTTTVTSPTTTTTSTTITTSTTTSKIFFLQNHKIVQKPF